MMYLTQANDLDHAATLTQAMTKKASLPVAGVYNPLSAKIAKDQGFQALYLSGASLSASLALPDLGVMTVDELIYAVRGILRASNLPLIVDCDTGYGEILNLMTLSKTLDDMGVAAIQIEDQVMPKKCGHLNDKRLIPVDDMCRKIVACKTSAKKALICARTDAGQISIDDAIKRAIAYRKAGADVIFVEALRSTLDMKMVREKVEGPLLANMTEFGVTPETSMEEWEQLGFDLVIYPVSSLRVAAATMRDFYKSLLQNGSASQFKEKMMTRAELYEVIDYHQYEELDKTIVKSTVPTSI
jgi:methylisocitrate lyase